MLAGDLERQVHPVLDRVVGRLEAEHQQRLARAAARRRSSPPPARRAGGSWRGEAPTGRSRAPRAAPATKSSNPTPQETLKLGPVLEPHPGLGDHAEDPLGADQRPVRRGPGAGAGQAAALPGAARGDRPHRLDQVVDVGVEGREVAAGAGRDPAAEGRELERLREVAQGQAVLAELVLERRARRPGLDPRRARDRRRPRAPGRGGARSIETAPRSRRRPAARRPPTTLVPPP